MGLRLHHVSSVVLICVVMLLRDNLVVDAAQPSEPFVDFPDMTRDMTWDMYNETFVGCFLVAGLQNVCLFPEKIRFKEKATSPVFSFSTKFIASILFGQPIAGEFGYGGSPRNALEGFTFAMLPHPNASLGGDGGYLGLLNATSNGDPKSNTFAVEFDFVKSPQFSDPDEGFHIGIDINSMNSTSWVSLEGPSKFTCGSNCNEFWPLQVWIDYDASSQILNVTTADISQRDCPFTHEERPGPSMVRYNKTWIPSNFLSHQVDLSDVINEYMYVGFTMPFVPLYGEYSGVQVQSWSLRTSNSTSPALPSAPFSCFDWSHLSFSQKYPFEVRLSAILVSLTAMAAIYALLYKCYSRWVERRGWRFKIDPDDLGDADPHKFTYKELAMATKNFDPKQALGRGGFGSVYKGFLPGNKQYVAVKRVAPESNQGEREFLAEVVIIGKIRHRNLVRLQGWCHERGELLLVYDYMPQGSLDKHLFDSPFSATVDLPIARDEQGVGKLVTVDEEVVIRFPWERRFKVVVDVATALVYLHTECEERIIHRDVKAANVMLDAKFNARLGDFGLARSYNHSLLTPESTNVAGTFGYFAPELFHTFKQTEQTDVYSFGALLLEVACGKKPIYHEKGEVKLLVEQVWQLWGSSCILDAADENLVGMFNVHEMTKVLCLGLLCSHPSPAKRPSMRQVLLILNGDTHLPEVPLSKPQFDYIPRSLPDNLSWTSNASSMCYTASTN